MFHLFSGVRLEEFGSTGETFMVCPGRHLQIHIGRIKFGIHLCIEVFNNIF